MSSDCVLSDEEVVTRGSSNRDQRGEGQPETGTHSSSSSRSNLVLPEVDGSSRGEQQQQHQNKLEEGKNSGFATSEIDLDLDGAKRRCSDDDSDNDSRASSSENIIFGVKSANQQHPSFSSSSGAKSSSTAHHPPTVLKMTSPFGAPVPTNKNLISNPFQTADQTPPSDLLVMMRSSARDQPRGDQLSAPSSGAKKKEARSPFSAPNTPSAPSSSHAQHDSLSASFALSSHPLIEALKNWSYSSFLVNKQRFAEKVLLPLQQQTTTNDDSSHSSGDVNPHVILKSRDPLLESRISCLKASRDKHQKIQRIVERQVIPALADLSGAFSSLALLFNELSTPSRTDFSSASSNGGDESSFSSLNHDHVNQEEADQEEEEEDLVTVARANISSSASSLHVQYKQLAHQLKIHGAESDKLRAGLDFFNHSLITLVSKSMQDTMDTIAELESARICFDAERNHHHAQLIRIATSSSLGANSSSSSSTPGMDPSDERTLDRLNALESKFLALKRDVDVKLNFLSFNQDKVMRKESALLSSLLSAFFAPSLTGQSLNSSSSTSSSNPRSNSESLSGSSNLDLVLKAYSIKPVVVTHQNNDSSSSTSGSLSGSASSRLAAARRSLSIPANLAASALFGATSKK